MEQTQKLKKYDFEKALKSGYSKGQIIESLRKNYDTNLDWEKINENLKEYSSNERDNILFDSLYNHQDSWGILGLKTKEQPKGLKNRILSNPQIQSIEQEVQKLPQWAIESALKPQIIGEALGVNGFWKLFQSNEEIARDNALKNALDKGIAQKLEKGEDLSIGEMMRYYQANEGMKGFFSPKAHYQKQKELKKIAQTDFQDLDDSQKQELQRQYLITRLWNSPKELHDNLKDEVTKKEADAHTQAVSERLERYIINLKRTYDNILKRGVDYLNDSTEQSDRYKEMLQESAISLGFDGIGFKGDRIYAFKGDKAIFIDDGFFHNLGQILGTNAFDIGGSITGAIAGAKRGKGKIGKLAGGIVGGAIGAGLGGIADSIIAQFNARGEFNLADALLSGAESATFDIAGGLIASGGAKAVKGATKGVQRLLDLAIPVSVLKNSIGSENIQAAKELIEQTYTPEQKSDILEFSKSFGGNLELEGKDTLLTKSAEFLTQKYGADSKIAQVANALENYSRAHNKSQAREEILTLIRADERGQTLGILLEVAKNSTLANKNLREILNATSYKLKKEIEGLGLKENAFKEVFRDLEKGTKEDYDEAFNKILGDLYADEKVVLDGEAYAKMREDMGELIELDPQGLGFLKFIEKGIYNPNGVNFAQLSNARKLLNSYYKEAKKNPNTNDFINNEVESAIREDIDKAAKQILLSRPEQYESAKRLYDTALGDYSAMLKTLKTLHNLEFNDLAKTNAQLMDNLINFIQGDGGLKEVNNYALLTKGLKKEQIESLELNALNRIYEKNLLKNSRDSTFEVFNSEKFLEDTAKLRKIFQSENAKKFVEIMQGFNRLFGNDAKIALELGFANPPKEGSAIAQSVKGAIEQKIVKGIFGILMRNLPTNNKIIDKLGFKERVQKMALAHHIEQALKSAYSINDFNFALKKISNDPNTPTPTRMAIESFNKELTKLLEEARENADISKNAKELEEALGKANLQDTQADFGTNYPQFYHKGSEAIAHLLETKSGQVQGAFYREDLQSLSGNGEIDLVWGEITDKTNHKGYGLAHIIDKHPELDLNKIPEIVENGKLVNQNSTNTIWHKQGDKYYKVGISKGFKGSGENQWVITAYEVNREKDKTFGDVLFTDKQPLPNSNDIIPQPKSLQEKIQILKAQRKQELQRAIQEKMAKEAQISQALREAQQERQRIKDAQVGKAINEVDLSLEKQIESKELKPTMVNLEHKSYPAKFVIIKKEDLKPNFETKGTQGRTQKQENIIKDIQENLNPNKLFFSEGGFEGLPIILRDGQVSVGNHRAEALKNLSQESREAYKKSAKEVFGIDLKDDELIVRMLDERIPENEILNLSFASNVGREQNLSEKALSTLGKYQENLDKLPTQIYAQNVEEMQQIVAKSLDKANNGLNTFDTNLALFTSLAKSKDKNILDAMSAISGDAEQKAKVIKMFVENAGNFHNLAKQTQMPNLDLRDYLTQALYFTAKADSSRVENFKEIAQEIKSILQTTDKNGKNALIDDKSHYDELVGKIMGYSFARFRELENPSGSLFDFLANIKQGLKEELEPTLFSAGRELQSANIYDFLSLAIKSGMPSNETSEVLELLPQLKAKHEAIKEVQGSATKMLESQNILNLDLNTAKTSEVRKVLIQKLMPLIKKGLIQSADNHKAYLSKASINKMISKACVQKSLNNGFTRAEHLQAVADIENLFTKAHLVKSEPHKSGEKNATIHRFNSAFKDNNALITTKESVENGKRIYSVELELTPRISNNATPLNSKINEGSLNSLQETRGGIKSESSIVKTDGSIIPQSTKEAIDPADRFAQPFSNEQFSALPKEIQAQYQSLQKQASEFNLKFQQAKGIEAKRAYRKQYNDMLDKIYNFEQMYSVRVPNTQMQVRGNTLPTYNPDEIIDVEIIEALPSIQKQIAYKRHNLRAKAIASLQIKLEALKPYPQKQIEYKRLESQINALVEKQHKELQQPSLFSEEDLAKARKGEIQSEAKQLESAQNPNAQSRIMPQTQLALINDRIKEFAKTLDNLTNPQNIQINDLASFANWLSGWNEKTITAEDILKNPRKFFRYFNSRDFDHLLLDIDACKYGVDLKIPEEVKQILYLLKSAKELKDFKYAEKCLKLQKADKDFRIKQFHRAEKLFKESRGQIEQYYNLFPLKEFGTNYAEYYRDGAGAIRKLLAEAKDYAKRAKEGELTESELAQGEFKGQVAGAFYRKDLEELSGNGDITLVWGEITDKANHKGYGLAHIIDKHPELDLNLIPQVIEQGKIEKTHNGFNILHNDYLVGINAGFNKNGEKISGDNFIVTAFENLKRETKETASANDFTKGAGLPKNSSDIIPQSQDIMSKKDFVENSLHKKQEILRQNIAELEELKTKEDFTSFEIADAIQRIQESDLGTEKSLGKGYLRVANINQPSKKRIYYTRIPLDINLQEKAIYFLKEQIDRQIYALRDEASKIQKTIDKINHSAEFYSKTKHQQYLRALQEALEKEEKQILKEQKEHNKVINLTFDINTKEGEKKVRNLFASYETTQEQKELFESVFNVAKKLDVKVRHAIRDPYEYLGDTKKISGLYTSKDNTARVKHNGNIDKENKPQILLHELIHSVTSRALFAYEKGQKEILTQRQIQAIQNIQTIFEQLSTQKNNFDLAGEYGLKNPHELLSELSNPAFTQKLKKINIFEKIINNIINLFISAKAMFGLKRTNAYDKLKNELTEVITNYKPNFTEEYEKQKFRTINLEASNQIKAVENHGLLAYRNGDIPQTTLKASLESKKAQRRAELESKIAKRGF